MGQRSIIWKHKLEDYVKDLHFEQRKNFHEITEIIKNEKKINICYETVRRFMSNEILHDNTSKDTIKQG